MLVYNALAKRQGVVLPGIGTLCVSAVPAGMQGSGVVVPPVNRVELVPDELPTVPYIIDLIAGYNRTDAEQAREIYNRWLAENCSEEGVTIESVGNIREGIFTPDPELQSALNPVEADPMRLPGRIDAKRVALWVIFAVLVGVGISVGAIVWYEYSEQMQIVRLTRQPVVPEAVPVVADTAVKVVPTAADSAAAASTVGDSVAAATPSPSSVPKQAEDTPSSEPAASGTLPAGSVSAGYHVIVGTYSTDQNAEKFIASAKKKDDALQYEKIPMPNGRILVSVFGAPTESEASAVKNKVAALFPDAWIYKSKTAR